MGEGAGWSTGDDRARELALARGRGYALLADLLARGLTASTRQPATASPLLDRALAAYAAGDDDGPAVDHHHVFGEQVPPFEGAFLDAEGAIGGAASHRLRALYARIGFAPDPRGEPAEHLATELRALAFASAAEADARRDRRADIVAHLEGWSRVLLDRHLLSWLPLMAASVRRVGRALPTGLVDQVEELALLHRSALGAAVEVPPELPPLPPILDDERTGLREVAAVLVTPALAGMHLCRDDLGALARRHRVPRGFGARAAELEGLLRSAARYDTLDSVAAGLADIARATRDALAAPRYTEVPGMLDRLHPWRTRCGEILALLGRLREAARRSSGEGR